MSNENKTPAWCPEERAALIPMLAAMGLTLVGFLLKFGGEATAGSVAVVNQLSYYAYAWAVAFLIGSSVKNNSYLHVDIFGAMFPPAFRNALKVLNRFLGLIVLAALFVGSCLLFKNSMAEGTMDEVVTWLPMSVVYLVPAVCFAVGVIRMLVNIVKKGE